MAVVCRVHSSDSQVFFDGERITGVQESSIEINKDKQDIQALGEFTHETSILKSNQTHKLNFTVLAIESGFNPFETGNYLSVDESEIQFKDTVGLMTASGAYMTSCQLDVAVGEIPTISVNFDVNDVLLDTGDVLTAADQTNDTGAIYYRPQDIIVTTDFGEGVSTDEFCLQSFSLSVPIDRKPINKMGQLTPHMRYPNLPAKGSLTFDIIKIDLVDIDLSSLILDSGDITLTLGNRGNQAEYLVEDCSFIGASESKNLDGNATLSLNYEFPLKKQPITVSYS